MKVGDMVQWKSHAAWDNSGLGVVTAIEKNSRVWGEEDTFQVTWLDDIEDLGWSAAITECAKWYDPEDMGLNIILFAETS